MRVPYILVEGPESQGRDVSCYLRKLDYVLISKGKKKKTNVSSMNKGGGTVQRKYHPDSMSLIITPRALSTGNRISPGCEVHATLTVGLRIRKKFQRKGLDEKQRRCCKGRRSLETFWFVRALALPSLDNEEKMNAVISTKSLCRTELAWYYNTVFCPTTVLSLQDRTFAFLLLAHLRSRTQDSSTLLLLHVLVNGSR
jgi:hypothetical protein